MLKFMELRRNRMDPAESDNKFFELGLFSDPKKQVFVLVTYRIDEYGRRLYSFTVTRSYVNRATGEINKTPWLHRRHIQLLHDLLGDVEKILIEDDRKCREAKRSANG